MSSEVSRIYWELRKMFPSLKACEALKYAQDSAAFAEKFIRDFFNKKLNEKSK